MKQRGAVTGLLLILAASLAAHAAPGATTRPETATTSPESATTRPETATTSAPRRICSLALAADEMLALLVPKEHVVCVSTFADDAELSNVAQFYPPSTARLAAKIEPVLASRPDLVIAAPWNDPAFRDVLAKSRIATFVLPDADSFEEIEAALVALGVRVGAEDRARTAAATMRRRLDALDATVRGIPAGARPRVLAFSHLIVAGRGTTADALIARAGARNVAAELGVVGHKQVALERIIAADPDWLLLGFDLGETRDTLLDAYPLLKHTRAAREGRVIVIAPRSLTAISPWLVDGAEQLARALHPALFGGAPR